MSLWYYRVPAFLLAFGGLLGALGSALEGIHFLRLGSTMRSLGDFASLLLYVGAMYAGVALWGAPSKRALSLVTVCFAFEIPIISWRGFIYTFSTLLNVRVLLGDVNRHLLADIGSSSNIYFLPGATVWMFGVNLVGVAGVFYLLWLRRLLSQTS